MVDGVYACLQNVPAIVVAADAPTEPIPSPGCPTPTWRSIASVPEDKEPSYAHKRIVKSKDISL